MKGSHTLQEIVDATGVELPALLAALALPAETDPHTAVRQLGADGLLVEVGHVRTAVAAVGEGGRSGCGRLGDAGAQAEGVRR